MPSADDVRRSGRAVPLGEVTVHVAPAAGPDAPPPQPVPDDVAVSLPVPSPPPGDPAGAVDGPTLLVAGPAGSTVEVLTDGTAVLRGGDVVVGVVPQGARLSAGADGLLEIRGLAREEGVAGDARVVVGGDPLLSADWADRGDEGGLSLVVVPRPWVRAGGAAGVEAVWSALGARADLGADAVAPGMRDQLECHAVGAPDKESWNLEPWRPDVGLLATLTARCNPD
ncbi:DUF2599 domain-containing protein [Actinotalea ferrariae]|uniref:DUF2599 domain-containing protein n=1 Tax=Actinotalea ferrariae TaxID=1386098 RepID=UPI0005517018|nr:DUF2599 domain-containing protein [Actinotalea ferrariae]